MDYACMSNFRQEISILLTGSNEFSGFVSHSECYVRRSLDYSKTQREHYILIHLKGPVVL